MPAPEHDATERDRLAPTSRRTFLGLAAAAGGAGLTAAPTVADGDGQPVTILAGPDQRDAVRAAAKRLRELQSGTRISLETAETARGIQLFTAGEVDVVAADRPLLPAERSRADEHGVDQALEELPTDAGTLTRPTSTWVDPLRPKRIAETWSADGPVSTWAEVSPSGGGSVDSTTFAADSTASVDGDDSVLVRGVRDAQYATGHGGVGYYEPDRAWLAADDGLDAEHAATTPVVQLSYLGIDRASLRTSVVEDLLEVFEAVSTDRVGDVDVFTDPYGVTVT